MAKFIVTVQYRVTEDIEETIEFMEQVEAERWQMLQKKFGLEPLELKVSKV